MFAGQVVAVRNGRGLGGVTSLVNDAHGTALAAVPNTQWTPASVRRLYTGPFGGARGASVDMGTDRQFLGKVRDASTGLTLLGARYYDEVVGRFVSVDPQLEPGVPAQFNAYVYAGNNPLTWSDPTGLFWGSSIVHSVSSWVSSHQAAIVGAVVGVAVGAGCLAATAGAGSIGCAAAAGAAGAAASNLWASKVQHTATFSWSSLARDTVVGAVVGAASAGIGSVAAPARADQAGSHATRLGGLRPGRVASRMHRWQDVAPTSAMRTRWETAAMCSIVRCQVADCARMLWTIRRTLFGNSSPTRLQLFLGGGVK